MSDSELSFFPSANTLNEPPPWNVDDFCTTVFSEMKLASYRDSAQIVEIRHYKEKNGLEHEFLLVRVKHGKGYHLLRIERSTPIRVRRTFWQKLKQTSSSILPARDTVLVSPSFEKLTRNMNRGPIIHVAALPISSGDVTLYDFCLLLSLFPSFSPTYKLREEQCYWFCNVIIATISSIKSTAPIPGEGFKRAGKYGRFSINVSSKARQLFIDGYQIVRRLQYESDHELGQIELTVGIAQALAAMLTVPSDEAKTHALLSITSLAHSLDYQQLLLDAGSADKLRLIFLLAPARLKALIFLALNALGQSDFGTLLDHELVATAGYQTIEDAFTEEDRKNKDSRYTKALLDLIDLLGDVRSTVRAQSATVIARLFRYDISHPFIRSEDIFKKETNCPFIVDALPRMALSSVDEVCLIGVRIVTELVQYSDLFTSLQEVMSRVFPILFKCPRHDVRLVSIASLRKLANTDQLRPISIKIFPLVTFLFLNDSEYLISETDLLYSDEFITSVGAAITRELSDSMYEDVHIIGLKAVSAAAKYRACQIIITNVFPQVVNLITSELPRVPQTAINVLSNLISNSEFRPYVDDSIPRVCGLLRDNNSDIRRAAVEFMTEAGLYAEFQLHVGNAIPRVFALLDDSSNAVQKSSVEFVIKAAFYRDFYSLISKEFPKIVELLYQKSCKSRQASINLLLNLIPHSEFHLHIEKTVPKVLDLVRDNGVQRLAVEFMTQVTSDTNFYSVIVKIFSKIVDFLTDESSQVRQSAVTLLCNILPHSEFQPYLGETIPKLLGLLRDTDCDVREIVVEFATKAASNCNFCPVILEASSEIVGLLADEACHVREKAVDLLSGLIQNPDFRLRVGEVIRKVFLLFEDSDSDVRRSAVGFLAKAALNPNFQPAILRLFPYFVGVLTKDLELWKEHQIAVNMLLSDLAACDEFQSHIEDVIVDLLEDANLYVQAVAIDFIKTALSYSDLCLVVIRSIPHIAHHLQSNCETSFVTVKAISLLSDLVAHSDICLHVIPELPGLLNAHNEEAREFANRICREIAFMYEHDDF